MSVLGYSDGLKPYVNFKNATLVVVCLFLVTNVIWFALGRPAPSPRQGVLWQSPAFTRSPMFLLSDILVVTAGLIPAYKLGVGSKYYRTAVTIYACSLLIYCSVAFLRLAAHGSLILASSSRGGDDLREVKYPPNGTRTFSSQCMSNLSLANPSYSWFTYCRVCDLPFSCRTEVFLGGCHI